MPIISSHVLDSVNGCHAAGIRVACSRLQPSGDREKVTDTQADESGRITITVDTTQDAHGTRYELVFFTREYFSQRPDNDHTKTASPVNESVVHLDLSSASERCHVPMMISPHSYSIWWSSGNH